MFSTGGFSIGIFVLFNRLMFYPAKALFRETPEKMTPTQISSKALEALAFYWF